MSRLLAKTKKYFFYKVQANVSLMTNARDGYYIGQNDGKFVKTRYFPLHKSAEAMLAWDDLCKEEKEEEIKNGNNKNTSE